MAQQGAGGQRGGALGPRGSESLYAQLAVLMGDERMGGPKRRLVRECMALLDRLGEERSQVHVAPPEPRPWTPPPWLQSPPDSPREARLVQERERILETLRTTPSPQLAGILDSWEDQVQMYVGRTYLTWLTELARGLDGDERSWRHAFARAQKRRGTLRAKLAALVWSVLARREKVRAAGLELAHGLSLRSASRLYGAVSDLCVAVSVLMKYPARRKSPLVEAGVRLEVERNLLARVDQEIARVRRVHEGLRAQKEERASRTRALSSSLGDAARKRTILVSQFQAVHRRAPTEHLKHHFNQQIGLVFGPLHGDAAEVSKLVTGLAGTKKHLEREIQSLRRILYDFAHEDSHRHVPGSAHDPAGLQGAAGGSLGEPRGPRSAQPN